MTVRIHVVDDEQAVRSSLMTILRTYGFDVETFGSGREFLARMSENKPDCVLLDVRMPGLDGFAVHRILSSERVSAPVIFLTGHGDIPMAVKAIKSGASDFIEKPVRDELLVESIRHALKNVLERGTAASQRETIVRRYRRLTARERSVLNLVSEGYSSQAIAGELAISIRTVDHHRARILEKMEATSLAQLIKIALELKATS